MHKPVFIWTSTRGRERNEFALFRLAFHLTALPERGQIHLFADTRYRLSINGMVAAHGPGRFKLAFPEFDTHDITKYLRSGANVIGIVVNSYARPTFLSDLSRGGLIAWGEVTDAGGASVRLATNEAWKTWSAEAWWPGIPRLTFAIGPGECLDARKLPPGWDAPGFDDAQWPRAAPVTEPGHWGDLRPRSIPLLDESEILPLRRLAVFEARYPHDEDIFRAAVVGENTNENPTWPVFTNIFSPEDQEILMGATSSDVFLNTGHQSFTTPRGFYLRHDYRLRLRKGWNSLLVLQFGTGGVMNFMLGLPRGRGLRIQAYIEDPARGRFLIGKPQEKPWPDMRREFGPLSPPQPPQSSQDGWQAWHGTETAHLPFADRTWKMLAKIEDNSIREAARRLTGAGSLVMLYDFGREVLGRPVLEMTASAGATVDLLYAERLNDDCEALHGYQDTRMAERYITRDGRQTWQTMHPRGMRYLDLVITGDLENFTLDRISLTSANYPVEDVGSFECSDPMLGRIWELSRDTQRVCMEDAYLDCPWRERGLYVGDMYVQFQNNLAGFGDRLLMRHGLEQFFQTQDESGLLAPCLHGLPNHRHPDYAAVVVQALWLYWARSGDLDFVRAHKAPLLRLIDGLAAIEQPGLNLVDGTGREPYIDLSYFDKRGINCGLNCFHLRAFSDAARLFHLLGDQPLAARCSDHAADIRTAIRAAFFDPATGLFVDRRLADEPGTQPSVHSNTLAALYDIAAPGEQQRIVEFLVRQLAENFRKTPPEQNIDCNVTSYFSYYTLAVLYRHGRVSEAERFIRRYWGQKLDQGAVTCWEYFLPQASLCHAWSAHPMHYLSTNVLGVDYAEPGNPNRIRIAPKPGSLTWAKGVYPHPCGAIRVSWERKAGGLVLLDYSAPAGVEVEFVGVTFLPEPESLPAEAAAPPSQQPARVR
jgi:hypothetical protein